MGMENKKNCGNCKHLRVKDETAYCGLAEELLGFAPGMTDDDEETSCGYYNAKEEA